jgi:hypothetical protein
MSWPITALIVIVVGALLRRRWTFAGNAVIGTGAFLMALYGVVLLVVV